MIYGWRGAKIGSYDIPNTVCGHCGNHEPQRITVYGKYVHVLWIPIFPTGKKKVAECTHCLKTIEEKNFPSDLRANVHHNADTVKRPIWHYLGLLIIGFFFGLSIIAGTLGAIFGDNTPDPRQELLDAYKAKMIVEPNQSMDSTAYMLKSFITNMVTEELDVSKNEYYTQVVEDKMLILVKMPELKRLEKSARPEIIEVIDLLIDSDEALKDKQRYIGVYGKYNLMLLKTPTKEKNSRLTLETPLLEFYGPKPPAQLE